MDLYAPIHEYNIPNSCLSSAKRIRIYGLFSGNSLWAPAGEINSNVSKYNESFY